MIARRVRWESIIDARTPHGAGHGGLTVAEPAWTADALMIFGITGDLARKMTFSARYRLERRGALTCPVVGVASAALSTQELAQRARVAIGEVR